MENLQDEQYNDFCFYIGCTFIEIRIICLRPTDDNGELWLLLRLTMFPASNASRQKLGRKYSVRPRFPSLSVRWETRGNTKQKTARTSAGDCIVKDDASYKIPANATGCQQKRRSKQSTELWSHTLGARSIYWPLKPWFFQASSFQLLKLEYLLRWSYFTFGNLHTSSGTAKHRWTKKSTFKH